MQKNKQRADKTHTSGTAHAVNSQDDVYINQIKSRFSIKHVSGRRFSHKALEKKIEELMKKIH